MAAKKTENVFEVADITTGALKSLLKTLAPFAGKEGFAPMRVTADSLTGVMTFRVTDGVRVADATLVTEIQSAKPGVCETHVGFSAFAAFVGIEETGKEAFQNEDAQILLNISANGLVICGRGAAGTRRLSLPAHQNPEDVFSCFKPAEASQQLTFESASEFAEKLNAAAVAMSRDEMRFALCAVCLRYDNANGVLKLCATDGRRATELDLEFSKARFDPEDFDALFSGETVKAVLNALKNAGEKSTLDVVIFRDAPGGTGGTGYFNFRTKHEAQISIVAPMVSATFPSLNPLFEKFALPGCTATMVEAAVLMRALEQICKSCPDVKTDGAHVHFEQETAAGLMKIAIFDALSRYTATVPGTNCFHLKFPPEQAEQKFNPELLAETLRAFGNGNVCLGLSEHAPRQVLITKPSDSNRPRISAQRSIVIGFS